jgi:hypothetical protein
MDRETVTEITFLSNFSWSNPNVLELLCETAKFNDYKVRHISKPRSFFKKRKTSNMDSPIQGIESKNLFNFSTKASSWPLLNRLQNQILWKQIRSNCLKKSKKILFYNNLDSLSGLSKKFKAHFDLLIYLCADYSELNERLLSNCYIADAIFVIPHSMHEILQKQYPQKEIILWPQPVTSAFNYPLDENQKVKLDKILTVIPKPRLIYAGQGLDRLNTEIYQSIPARFTSCSFISFGGTEFKHKNNLFEIPSVSKQEMLYIISQCQVGFMPYEVSDPHNLHCVPLKLFDYFSAGLPVVSAKLLNISQYKELLFLCETLEEFEYSIKKSLSEKLSSEVREKRKAVYSLHSTVKRSDEFKTCINQLIKGSESYA